MDRPGIFKHWFQDHFLEYAVPTRPLLLLIDGHSSHYEPSSVELAKNNDVILFCLPPHTIQDSQPLDCTVFGPLKRHWSTVCHEFLHNHPGVVIKYCSTGLLHKTEKWGLSTPLILLGPSLKCKNKLTVSYTLSCSFLHTVIVKCNTCLYVPTLPIWRQQALKRILLYWTGA